MLTSAWGRDIPRRLTMKYLALALAFALAYTFVAAFIFAVPFDMVR